MQFLHCVFRNDYETAKIAYIVTQYDETLEIGLVWRI